MSPNSNIGLNEIISWKGRTFNQITSYIRKNGGVNSNINVGTNIFNRLPLKIYRREIAVPTETTCKQGHAMRLDLLNAPGGTITNSAVNAGGLVNTLDFNLTENSSERPGSACDGVCVSTGSSQSNALRRLRSGGMMKKQFDLSSSKQTYYTNSQQYINSRNRGFNQNQFYYTRIGNTSSKPGDSLTTNNIYTTNTLTDCKKIYISEETSFLYTWVNTTTLDPVTVTVPAGYYNINDINNLLHNTMIANAHYYRHLDNQSKIFLLNFSLNNTTGFVELVVSQISDDIVLANHYGKALVSTALGVRETTDWATPTEATSPQITILNNSFKNVIGFDDAVYPAVNTDSVVEPFIGTSLPLLQSEGNRVYYKPNNPQFAQQGAVTSGSKIARIRYDTITNSASSYRTAFGMHVSNALAYGVPANGYTIKDKLGYPNPNTPTVTTTGEMRFCK
jgi:hypothetical protein